MLGAIIGDIAGSRFEFENNKKTKDFLIFHPSSRITDDSLMTLAIAKALIVMNGNYSNIEELKATAIYYMKEVAADHEATEWGKNFYKWLFEKTVPYNSFGNGAGMRISPVGWVANSPDEVKILSKALTEVSHNHPEGLKGAECIAMLVYYARIGKTKEELKDIATTYYPKLKNLTYEDVQPNYGYDDLGNWISCQGSIPEAILAFLASTSFEDCVRNCINLGGDSDTIGAMGCSIAEAYYGIDNEFEDKALEYLSDDLLSIYYAFESVKKPRIKK